LFHVDRWADMTKLTVTFHNSANAPKSVKEVRIGAEAGDRNGLTRATLSFYTEKKNGRFSIPRYRERCVSVLDIR
jgi:hypothetical protein